MAISRQKTKFNSFSGEKTFLHSAAEHIQKLDHLIRFLKDKK